MTDDSDDRAWRTRLQHSPWPVRMVTVVVLCTGVYLALWSVHHSRHQSWQEAAVTGAIQGLVLFGLLTVLVRSQGGPEAARLAQRAIRRRQVPDDADPDVLRTGLEGFRRTNLRLRWWLLGCLVLLALLAVGAAALRGDAALLAVLLIPLILGIAYPLLLRARLRRVDALLAELDRRQPTVGNAG